MYKKLVILTAFILFVAVNCSKKGRYSDAIKVFEDVIQAEDTFSAQIVKAETADDAVAEINKLAGSMKDFQKKMTGFDKKYPELKNQSGPPAELKDVVTRFMKASKKMAFATKNVFAKFNNDPKILAAYKNLAQSMQ